MEIPQVTVLPLLNQEDFPALPEVPNGRTLVCFDTEWQNAEKELAAGCIVTACVYAKKWHPVPADQLVDRMRANPMIAPVMAQNVGIALWELVGDGFIEVVSYQDANHFVPTPRLANAVLADNRKLRVA